MEVWSYIVKVVVVLALPNILANISITTTCILLVSKAFVCARMWDNYVVTDEILKGKGFVVVDDKVVGITIDSVVRAMESNGKAKYMRAVSWGIFLVREASVPKA